MEVIVRDLGNMRYKQAWELQESLLQQGLKIKGEARGRGITDPFQLPTSSYLLFVEHPPVYTLGKSGSMENVLISEE
ncbi:MAG: lipoyl(octanoyl) transferase, partial [Sphingobacteriales bacterium]